MDEFISSGRACCFNSLSESVAEINALWKERWRGENPGLCFRGVDSFQYSLNPSLLREPYPESYKELAQLENSLWVDFRLRSKPLLGHHVNNAWEAMLTMQQYGFPTRLLDWSRSLAVAAYFAVRDIENDDDGAVWVMAGREPMNIKGYPPNVWRTVLGDPWIENMALPENATDADAFADLTPVLLSPDQTVTRMIAQRGIYSLHTYNKCALEELAIEDREENGDACFLHKLIIPSTSKESLRSELLVVAGISEETLFPDIEGFARDFVWEFKRKSKKHKHS